MRKITLALVGIVTAVSLTACADAAPDSQEITSCGGDMDYGVGCAVTVTYKGNPLNCVSWDGSHGEVGLNCDFVEYNRLYGPADVSQ